MMDVVSPTSVAAPCRLEETAMQMSSATGEIFSFLAMDSATDPAKRYELVTDVVQGMKDNQGAYTRQIGAYTLTCTRDSTMAVLSFINNGVPVETPTPAPTASPDPNTTPDPNATPDANAPTDAPADGFIG